MAYDFIGILIQVSSLIITIIIVLLKFRNDIRKYYEKEASEREELIEKINDLKVKIIELETKLNHLSGNFKQLSNTMKDELDNIHSKDASQDLQIGKMNEIISSRFENFVYILEEIRDDISELKSEFKEHCKSENKK